MVQATKKCDCTSERPVVFVEADECAKLLRDEEFVRSADWTDRFGLRLDVSCRKASGEAQTVNCETAAQWLSTVWPKLHEGHPDSDIFNADETGLFFRLTSERTLKFKGEKCVGGKLAIDRVTVLACANAGGTEKRNLFVIGESKEPRCLKMQKAFQFGTTEKKSCSKLM
jgi:hypothetical protein